jgi:hypothetical protein
MKTPLQLLIDFLTKYDGMPTVRVICKCQDLLAIEREHIQNAYNQGYRKGEQDSDNGVMSFKDVSEFNNAANYWQSTYGTNEPKQ